VTNAGVKRACCHGAFQLFAPNDPQKQTELRSQLYLFQTGEWFVKFRCTYRAVDATDAESMLSQCVGNLKVPDAKK
jgi:hypothetical protein